ncbi:FG-GAP-like repeat-containing protein [Streptomyces sp. NPDC048057]|uniref:FG-GAP-like repeat-containing protein n=1 Tax=Streptomyces sp. NPDC048057 TaxID=3155628 RepID=UPI0033CFF625
MTAQALAVVMAAGLLGTGQLMATAPAATAAPQTPHTATPVYLTSAGTGAMISAQSINVKTSWPKGDEDRQQLQLEPQANGNHRIRFENRCVAMETATSALLEMRSCGADTEFRFEHIGGDRYRIAVPGGIRRLHANTVGGNLVAFDAADPTDAARTARQTWYVTPIDPQRQALPQPGEPGSSRVTYDQMTYLTTHNSFWNTEDLKDDTVAAPAQPHSIATQLNDGVRGLMLDVYDGNTSGEGSVRLCHGNCDLGTVPLVPTLRTIKDWLDAPANSQEIVTLHLEDRASKAALEADLAAVPGLAALIYNPRREGVAEQGWPTVSEMISRNKRLVVFSSAGHHDERNSGIMYNQNWTVENYWEMGLPGLTANWSCYSRWEHIPLVREEGKFRRLFVMNHFRSYPSAPTSANDNAKLANRAGRFCMPAARKKPNFLAIDQYRDGNPMAAVDEFKRFTYHGDSPLSTVPRLAVMPLGDSITLGVGSSSCSGGVQYTTCEGYRRTLRDSLDKHATTVDFVGSQQAGRQADRDHEGHSGWMIDGIAANVDNWLAVAKPNVVTLHIGSNDINRDHLPAQAPERLSQLLNRITTAAPDMTVVLGRVVPNSRPGKQPQVDAFNQALPGIVDAQRALGRKVLLVDLGLDNTDLADGLHPNDDGFRKMATAFYGGVTTAINNGWITENVTVTPGPPPAGASVQGDYDVDITGDGRADYLVLGPNGAVDAYQSDGGSAWTNLGRIANGSAAWTRDDVRFADVTGDGRADYLVLGPNGAVDAYRYDGGTAWTNLGRIANGSAAWTKGDVRFADVTGDGRADYLVLGPQGAVEAHRYDGGTAWTNLGRIANGSAAWTKGDVRFADITGDGRADYLVLGPQGAVEAHQYDGGTAWTPLGTIGTGSAGWTKEEVRFADVTGDGRAEYLVMGPNGSLDAHRYEGNNNWTDLGRIAGGSASWTRAQVRI